MREVSKLMQKKIIQLSDLHFGEYKYSEDLKTNTIKLIMDENPDLIIVAGDLTGQGYIDEYQDASEFLDELKSITETCVVPGNHDACNVGLIHFKKYIGERKFIFKDKNSELVIIGLDSSEPDIHDGQIGLDQLEWLDSQLRVIPDTMRKIVTFHHHILPIPQTGRERNILLDAGDLLKILIEHKVELILNGHKHVPYAWKLENMVTLNSGTATTRRLHGENIPSYNQIYINNDMLQAELVNTENGTKKQLANYPLEYKRKTLKSNSTEDIYGYINGK